MQARTSQPVVVKTSSNQYNAPGTVRSQHNERRIQQAGHHKTQKQRRPLHDQHQAAQVLAAAQRNQQRKANHRGANTTVHQRNCRVNNDPSSNRAPVSSTPNQAGVHRSKRERCPAGWRHHGAPPPPAASPANTIEHRNCTSTQPANQHKHATPNPLAARESASLTESGGVSTRHGM